MTQKEHAEFSASASERWLNCPGSHELSKRYPPLPETEYSKEGTKAHACLEYLLKAVIPDWNNGIPQPYPLRIWPKLAQQSVKQWPEEMVKHCVEAANYILEARQAVDGELLCETKVDASPFTCTGQFGTLDAAIIQPFGVLEIVDFKYGAGIAVDPRNEDGTLNSQLTYYGLGLAHLYHFNFSEVKITVIQPRAYHPSGETVRSTTATITELQSWHQRFRDGVMETSDPNAKLQAGKWCKFCPVKLDCPELKDESFKQASLMLDDISGLVETPAVATLPNLGTVLNACDKIEEWIKAVRAHAMEVLERGGTVPGWKLVQKRSTRYWTDPEATKAEAQFILGDAAFHEPELKSPAQIEKAFGKAGKEWVKGKTTDISTGHTMAPESDSRPAVNNISLFTELLPE